ncbi:MAG: hypothetical protein IIA45_15270, partial [Bacteroidetes bacterium]|nr:hypothetical protein [Bacteroidota bacterium]
DKPFSGLVKETADNGDYILHHMKNGRIELQMGYYADNSWERVVEMEDGMEHGKLLMFHPNGEKYIEQHYHHGEPIGLWSIWDDQGVLLEEKQHRVIIYKKEDQMKKSPVKE